ncbi:hypothetical protein [Brevundimonas balnearis]|uniref:Uncharacterized protein n=1 Tax=Brevundimonas balnearis TaxID=1572858 RepID=A0ABV6R1F3_9CAUL
MAITLGTLPRLTTFSMRAVSAANDLRPSFGGPVQRLGRKGSRFALDVKVPAMSAKGCGIALIADLLRGETETVILPVPDYVPAVPYGTPLVNGAGQLGTTLVIDGLTPNVAILKGKFLSVILGGQRYVHIVAAQTTANGSGQASLPIWPMLRTPTTDNAVVELAAPKIEGFVQPGQEWSISRLQAVGVDFSVEERA